MRIWSIWVLFGSTSPSFGKFSLYLPPFLLYVLDLHVKIKCWVAEVSLATNLAQEVSRHNANIFDIGVNLIFGNALSISWGPPTASLAGGECSLTALFTCVHILL